MIRVYKIIDEDGRIICEGDIDYVTAMTGLSKANIYGMVKGNEMGIKCIAEDIRSVYQKKVEPTIKDDIVSYVRRHIKAYGNTVLSRTITEKEVNSIIAELKKEGMNLKAKYTKRDGAYGGWVLEVEK